MICDFLGRGWSVDAEWGGGVATAVFDAFLLRFENFSDEYGENV